MKYYILILLFFSLSTLSAQIPLSEKGTVKPIDTTLTLYSIRSAEIRDFKERIMKTEINMMIAAVYRTEENKYYVFGVGIPSYRKVYRYDFDEEKNLIAKVESSLEEAVWAKETYIKLKD